MRCDLDPHLADAGAIRALTELHQVRDARCGLPPEVGEDVTHVDVQVHERGVLARHLRDRRGEIGREEGLPRSALGREDRDDVPALRSSALGLAAAGVRGPQVRGPRDGPLHGFAQLVGPLGHVHDVADPRPHRCGQESVPRVIADQHDRGPRGRSSDELGQSECVSLFDLGGQDQHIHRVVGADQELLGRGGGLDPAHLLGLELERSSQLLAERLRRPDGDDARVRQGVPTPVTLANGTPKVAGEL